MFSRMSQGWQIARSAMKILAANKQLLVFPIISALATMLVIASFFAGLLYSDKLSMISDNGGGVMIFFLFYLVSYFITVFFNMALTHCTTLYLRNEPASVADGLSFSVSRIGLIFSWALFSATIGILLKVIQDNLGNLGRIIGGVLGFTWTVGTFFVIPVIAYERLTPFDAVQRSIQLMKEKWGESLGARFSFGLIVFLFSLVMAIVAVGVSELVNEGLGIGMLVIGVAFVLIIVSAIRTIITAAAYHGIDDNIDTHFNRQMLEGLFEER